MEELFSQKKIIVFTDGGARGNPGPAAIGVVIGGKKYGLTIGLATNNEAEYRAVIFALQKVKQLLGKKAARRAEIELNTDSELLYHQITGGYKILEPNLQRFFIEIWNLKHDFQRVSFQRIPREQNKEADRLVNAALDDGVGDKDKLTDAPGRLL